MVHCLEKGPVPDLHDVGAQRTAQIGDFLVPESFQMRDCQIHALIIINAYICGVRIADNMIVVEDRRSPACLEIFHPWLSQGKPITKVRHNRAEA